MRIASLLPAATEIVRALGLGHHLAAVTFECAAEARSRSRVVVDTAIPPGLTAVEIDAWVRRSDRPRRAPTTSWTARRWPPSIRISY